MYIQERDMYMKQINHTIGVDTSAEIAGECRWAFEQFSTAGGAAPQIPAAADFPIYLHFSRRFHLSFIQMCTSLLLILG